MFKTLKNSSIVSAIQKEGRIWCKPICGGTFEPNLFGSEDAIEIAGAIGEGYEALPIPTLFALEFHKWFEGYLFKDVDDPYDEDGVWLEPNRHPAYRGIASFLEQLNIAAVKWREIQKFLSDSENPSARSIVDAMEDGLAEKFHCFVESLSQFQDYEIVEV